MQRLRRKLAWMLVGLLLAHDGVWAASELPELGDASQDVLTPQMQRRLGEGFYNEIRLRDPAYIDDPEISGYVNRVGQRLVSASQNASGRFTFFVLRDRQINAFATFGGYVGINTGLLLAAGGCGGQALQERLDMQLGGELVDARIDTRLLAQLQR